jgi:hypothetical protein
MAKEQDYGLHQKMMDEEIEITNFFLILICPKMMNNNIFIAK